MFLPRSQCCCFGRVWFASNSEALIEPEISFCLLIFFHADRLHKELLYGFVCSASGCLFTLCLDRFFFSYIFSPAYLISLVSKKKNPKNSTFQCFCCNKCVICYLKIAIVAGSQSNIYAMSSSCEFYLVLTMPFIIISTCSYLSLLFISCSQTCHGQEVHMLLNKVFLQTALLLYVFGFPLFTELTQMHEKQNLRSWGLKKNIYSFMVLKIFPNLLCSLEFHWWFL